MRMFPGHGVFAALLMLTLLATAPAPAQVVYKPFTTTPEDMELVDVGRVEEVLKSDLIKLDNEKIYKVDAIRIPVDYDKEAVNFIKTLLKGKTVGIYINPTLQDGRYDNVGNIYAHLITDDGKWLQAELAAEGLAWVYGSTTNRDLLDTLYEYEAQARLQKRGFWREARYQIQSPNNLVNKTGSFQILEGTVVSIGNKLDYFFYNFGRDPQTDFTASFNTRDVQITCGPKRQVVESNAMTGRRVRIRGWIEENNGPMIRLTHPEQIRIIDNIKCGR